MKSIFISIRVVDGSRFLFQLVSLFILLFGVNVWAQNVHELTSPDGKLKATVNLGDKITYSLIHVVNGGFAARIYQ